MPKLSPTARVRSGDWVAPEVAPQPAPALPQQPIAFNGKFLAAEPTGVHRVAEELIRAVDLLLAEAEAPAPEILAPRDVRTPPRHGADRPAPRSAR